MEQKELQVGDVLYHESRWRSIEKGKVEGVTKKLALLDNGTILSRFEQVKDNQKVFIEHRSLGKWQLKTEELKQKFELQEAKLNTRITIAQLKIDNLSLEQCNAILSAITATTGE